MIGFARLLIASFLALAPLTAMAQHKHAHDEIGPNGGPVEHLGNSHVELVLKGKAVQVYLYDDNMKPQPAQGAEVTVTVQAEGKRETVKLQVAGANLMQGQGTLEAGKGARTVVALKLPGKPIVQARFTQ
jgi:hypothetical protein